MVILSVVREFVGSRLISDLMLVDNYYYMKHNNKVMFKEFFVKWYKKINRVNSYEYVKGKSITTTDSLGLAEYLFRKKCFV